MGASVQPQAMPDVGKAVAALRSQGADDETVHRYLTEHMGLQEVGPTDPMAQYHKDYKSGALQKRTAVENANDQGRAQDAADADTYGDRLGSMAERAASNLPLGGLALSGARYLTKKAIGEPETWQESREANAAGAAEGGANAPGVSVPMLGRVTLADLPAGAAGFRAMLRAAPGLGPISSGALYNGVTRASSAAPESTLSRVGGTALATTIGAAIPTIAKGAELAGVMDDARMGPTLSANINARIKARAAASKPAFDAFRNLGDLDSSPELDKILNLPVVAKAGRTVQGESPTLNTAAPTNAGFLDAIYKRVGNKAFTTKHGVETGEARDALGSAIEDAAQAKGGSYKAALDAFREPSQEIEAVKRGALAMNYAGKSSGAPLNVAGKFGPEAFADYAGDAARTPGQIDAAQQGVLGQLQRSGLLERMKVLGSNVPLPYPSKALRAAPDVLRSAGSSSFLQRLMDLIQQ